MVGFEDRLVGPHQKDQGIVWLPGWLTAQGHKMVVWVVVSDMFYFQPLLAMIEPTDYYFSS